MTQPFSDPKMIPDGLEVQENGSVIAKYCTTCGHFTKGKSLHSAATGHGNARSGSQGAQNAGQPTGATGPTLGGNFGGILPSPYCVPVVPPPTPLTCMANTPVSPALAQPTMICSTPADY